jgi:hypothetical protein
VGQGSVDQVGEHGFDDCVAAVDDVGLDGGQGRVGEERVLGHRRSEAEPEAALEGL